MGPTPGRATYSIQQEELLSATAMELTDHTITNFLINAVTGEWLFPHDNHYILLVAHQILDGVRYITVILIIEYSSCPLEITSLALQ